MGRPPVSVEKHIDRLEEAILRGATLELAAKYAGISKPTLIKWREQAESAEPGSEFYDLRQRIERAEGLAAMKWLTAIDEAANVDWKAAAWKLERRFPHFYSRLPDKQSMQTISTLLEAVLKEFQGQQPPQEKSVNAEWSPLSAADEPGERPALPPPPSPDEEGELW